MLVAEVTLQQAGEVRHQVVVVEVEVGAWRGMWLAMAEEVATGHRVVVVGVEDAQQWGWSLAPVGVQGAVAASL